MFVIALNIWALTQKLIYSTVKGVENIFLDRTEQEEDVGHWRSQCQGERGEGEVYKSELIFLTGEFFLDKRHSTH